tara:strand:+ start:1066 stop:1374 length:309 start_codon:yes stop_codon:yes gene_type:complete
MLIKFEKKESVLQENHSVYANQLIEKIENKIGIKLHGDKNNKTTSGHISVAISKDTVLVWVFLYDKNGVHESESNGKIIKQNSDLVKKFTGIIPKIKDLEKL